MGGGQDLTEYLMRLLREERGYQFSNVSERRAARAMKEQFGYVAQDYRTWEQAEERSYTLPDGNAIIAASDELFHCSEPLFKPGLFGKDLEGIHELAFKAITKCDVDIQKALSANVVLTGGAMLFQGMQERMLKELTVLAPPTMPIKVMLPD